MAAFEPSRRGFLAGVGAALITAPAIVRASSLMAVKAMEDEFGLERLITESPTWPFDSALIRRAFLPRLFVQLYEQSPILGEIMRLQSEANP